MTAPKAAGRRGAKRRMSKAGMLQREKRIINDIKKGILSYRQIAEKHSVSLPTVNNKARKAGISRGRRKGAKILVMGPKRRTTTKTAARKKSVRRVAKKAVARKRVVRKKTARKTTRRVVARQARPAKAGFSDAFRDLVLNHYPSLSLKKFDKLTKLVAREVG